MENHGKLRRLAREVLIHGIVFLVVFGVLELILVYFQLSYLRLAPWDAFTYRYNSELGWSPVPGSNSDPSLTVIVRNNSLGIRDAELDDSKPKILFVGDSMVWGWGVQAADRFTDILGQTYPNYQILNAGVSGYGTDQQYLQLRRLWDRIRPTVVVLTFCAANDRQDNRSNARYFSYKPYLQETSSGIWQFRGQPVPKSRGDVFKESWAGRNLMVARLAISAYTEARYPRVSVPDPTERLVGMMRDFVHENGARFLVGLQDRDLRLEAYLRSENVPFVTLEGGEVIAPTVHWTPKGHAIVAGRYVALLAENGIKPGAAPVPLVGADR